MIFTKILSFGWSKKISGDSVTLTNNTNTSSPMKLWALVDKELYGFDVMVYNPKSSQNIKEYNQSLQRVKEIITQGGWLNLPPVERALKAYEWLGNNVRYQDGEFLGDDQTAYSAIIGLASVCTGYAKGMKMFLDELKIPNLLIIGDVGREKHIWNMIELEGKWYHVDATWGAKTSLDNKVNYNYFLVNDYDLQRSRQYIKKIRPEQMGQKYRGYKLQNFIQEKKDVNKILEKIVSSDNGNKVIFTTPYYRNNYFEELIEKSIVDKTKKHHTYKKRYSNRNFVTYQYLLPRVEDKQNVNLTIKKYQDEESHYILQITNPENTVFDDENIFIENAEIKKVVNQNNSTLVYLHNFNKLNPKIKINIYKIGYKFIYNQEHFDFEIKHHPLPQSIFRPENERSGYLTNIEKGMKYKINNSEWININDNKDIYLENIDTKTLYVVKEGKGEYLTSLIQKIDIKKMPDIRTIRIYKGYVTGINPLMEYKEINEDKWKEVTENKIKLGSGKYLFRFKGKNNVLYSESYLLNI
ncbi:transglutaminase domain-containing protein [Metamycoplasma canadense]|uniref:transglutaminase domain-containing protein n=1 Tax=Metamycoplasma canadense TaxID=29554 RepID=UPI0005EF8FD9|nr:transglutaminase domain-containing protein [Metamycoplasma canadense]